MIKQYLILLSLFFVATHIQAMQLGEVKNLSSINQPVKVEIPINNAGSLANLNSLRVRIASEKDYRLAGIDRIAIHQDLEFTVKPSGRDDGKAVIYIASKTPQQDAYIDFLIELHWLQGRLVKEITILYDIEVPSFVSNPQPTTIITSVDKIVASKIKPVNNLRNVRTSHSSVSRNTKESYLVKKGDTLWSIATRYSKRLGVTNQQFLVSIQQANSSLATNGLHLVAGEILYIPSIKDSQIINSTQAYHKAKELLANQKPLELAIAEATIEEVVYLEEESDYDGVIIDDVKISEEIAQDYAQRNISKRDIVKQQLNALKKSRSADILKNPKVISRNTNVLPEFHIDKALEYDYVRAIKYFWDHPKQLKYYPYIFGGVVLLLIVIIWDRRKRRHISEHEEEIESYTSTNINMEQEVSEFNENNMETADYVIDIDDILEENDSSEVNDNLQEKSHSEREAPDNLADFFDADNNQQEQQPFTTSEAVSDSTEKPKAIEETPAPIIKTEDSEIAFSDGTKNDVDLNSQLQFALKCIEVSNHEEATKVLEEMKNQDPNSPEVTQLSKAIEKTKEEREPLS